MRFCIGYGSCAILHKCPNHPVGVHHFDFLRFSPNNLARQVPDHITGGRIKPDPVAFKDIVPSHKQSAATGAAPAASASAAAVSAGSPPLDGPASRAGVETHRDSPHFKLGQAPYNSPAPGARQQHIAAAKAEYSAAHDSGAGADIRSDVGSPTSRPQSSRRPPGGASTFTFG